MKLARAQARSSGKEEDQSLRHLFQRFSVLLFKGNAALLLNRNPSFPLPSVDGDLPLLIREIFHASLQKTAAILSVSVSKHIFVGGNAQKCK